MVEVFIWNFRGSSAAWGHASMRVGGEYISWWPQGNNRRHKLPAWTGPFHNIYSVPAIPGRDFEDDVNAEEQKPDHRIVLSGLDEAAIKKWWVEYRKGGNQWATLDQNCSTTVALALRAGGGDRFAKGVSGWWRSWNVVWSPNDVLLYATAIQAGLGSAPKP